MTIINFKTLGHREVQVDNIYGVADYKCLKTPNFMFTGTKKLLYVYENS